MTIKNILLFALLLLRVKSSAQIDTLHNSTVPSFRIGATIPLGLNLSLSYETPILKQKRLTIIPSVNLLGVVGFYNRSIPNNVDKPLIIPMITLEGRYYLSLQKQIEKYNSIFNRPAYYIGLKQYWISDPIIKGNQYILDYDRGTATAIVGGLQVDNNKWYLGGFAGFVFISGNTTIPLIQLGATIGRIL